MVKFVGKVRHAVDAKGRLMIPSKYRAIIGEQTLYILPGESGNLTVYTEESFDRLADRIDEKLENAEYLTAEDEADIRSWIASADYVNLDPQGRILIGQEHRGPASEKKPSLTEPLTILKSGVRKTGRRSRDPRLRNGRSGPGQPCGSSGSGRDARGGLWNLAMFLSF